MIKNNKLMGEWRVHETDSAELQSFLLNHFGSSTQSTSRVVDYTRDDRPLLRLSYAKSGKLLEISTTAELTKTDIRAIGNGIESFLLAPGKEMVGRSILFAHDAVEGHFERPRDFAILPLPVDAPRPPFGHGDHPFALEFTYTGSVDAAVRASRHARRARELELILCALVPAFKSAGSHSIQMEWVLGRFANNAIAASEFLQLGYHYPGDGFGQQFSPNVGIPVLGRAPANEVYGGRRPLGPAHLPDDLEASLDRVHQLDPLKRAKFVRAAYWLQTAGLIWHLSSSTAHVALVSAIEALFAPVQSQPCDACGKPIGPGPTALFKTFIEEHLPSYVPAAVKSELYSVRSAIAHGDRILLSDMGLAPTDHLGAEEWSLGSRLMRVVRLAAWQWLHHGRQTAAS
ncbi:hypothetical protein [Phenylobacterium sp.]|uniref:hypothetical protein n=1 Tax=Phenylobacterium sp. TaxID=1871053 RepID=UPI00272FDEBF|nr:hypothetical protein [Phenylobacterium sp.]MDP1598727.1 hypothetical protein [Phenylobacterium sp.]